LENGILKLLLSLYLFRLAKERSRTMKKMMKRMESKKPKPRISKRDFENLMEDISSSLVGEEDEKIKILNEIGLKKKTIVL